MKKSLKNIIKLISSVLHLPHPFTKHLNQYVLNRNLKYRANYGYQEKCVNLIFIDLYDVILITHFTGNI